MCVQNDLQNYWYEFTSELSWRRLVESVAQRYKPLKAEVLQCERTLRDTHTGPGCGGRASPIVLWVTFGDALVVCGDTLSGMVRNPTRTSAAPSALRLAQRRAFSAPTRTAPRLQRSDSHSAEGAEYDSQGQALSGAKRVAPG